MTGSSMPARLRSFFKCVRLTEIRFFTLFASVSRQIAFGGDNGANPSSYNVNTPTITLADATKTGYVFLGWWDAEIGGNRVYQIPEGSTGNMTLYARGSGSKSIETRHFAHFITR